MNKKLAYPSILHAFCATLGKSPKTMKRGMAGLPPGIRSMAYTTVDKMVQFLSIIFAVLLQMQAHIFIVS